ncbi:MAG: hypothetical protein ABFD54_11335 [Armatimonadota bacterium]
MAKYAEKTKTSVASSKAEIEAILNRFGIRDIVNASVMFKRNGRPYVIEVAIPDPNAEEFLHTPGRRIKRTKEQAYVAWEQACRVKWREIALLLKAKLVAISNQAARFEDEFLAYQMLPSRGTFGQWAEEQSKQIEASGQMPSLLVRNPGGRS